MCKIKKVILWIIICFSVHVVWYPASLALNCDVCEDNVVNINKQDNGKEITIDVGDILHIQLERFGGTGYEWYLDKSFSEFFELIGEDTETISCKGHVGAPVMQKWKLKAIKNGMTEVTFHLYRVWEGKDKAADLFTTKVNILIK